MNDLAREIMRSFDPGNPVELEKFINNASIKDLTAPVSMDNINITGLKERDFDFSEEAPIIQEKLTFPSTIERRDKNDRAVFYLYRKGELKGRDVILWVPGMGVSKTAFRFIKKFFREEISRGYDILFYVPPFHLERTEEGRENGEGFLTSGTLRNIRLFLDCVRELRTAAGYLRGKGVRTISGWGGSAGAAFLLLASNMVKFDHLCLMIPLLDLNTVALNRDYMGPVISKFAGSGFSVDLIKKGYDLISPIRSPFNMNPGRVQILYAKYDQLTPESLIINFAEKNGITNISGYERGHATILLTSGMYHDYGKFLDSLKNNH